MSPGITGCMIGPDLRQKPTQVCPIVRVTFYPIFSNLIISWGGGGGGNLPSLLLWCSLQSNDDDFTATNRCSGCGLEWWLPICQSIPSEMTSTSQLHIIVVGVVEEDGIQWNTDRTWLTVMRWQHCLSESDPVWHIFLQCACDTKVFYPRFCYHFARQCHIEDKRHKVNSMWYELKWQKCTSIVLWPAASCCLSIKLKDKLGDKQNFKRLNQ